MIVADANLLSYFFLDGPRKAEADKALKRDSEWVAPVLWRSEFRSVLALQVRVQNLTAGAALEIMRDAEQFMDDRERHVASAAILGLAFQSGCSAYDCEYVALAQGLLVPLVTSDRRILASFPKLAVSLEDFVA